MFESWRDRFVDPMKLGQMKNGYADSDSTLDVPDNSGKNRKKPPKPKILWFNPIIFAFSGPVIIGAFIFAYNWIHSTNARIDMLQIEFAAFREEIVRSMARIEAKADVVKEELKLLDNMNRVNLALKRVEAQIKEKSDDLETRIKQIERDLNERK